MVSRRVLTFVLTIATITVNALANILPFNGQTTAEISDRFPTRFVPAGYVFAIWGLIYLGLILFAIYQMLPAQRSQAVLDKIAPAYWVASVANAAWIVLWHYEFFELTLPVMLVLLGSLIAIYRATRTASGKTSFAWCVQVPFSIYLGWISVATIANAAQLLTFLNWDGWGISAPVWAVIMLLVATGLGFAMLAKEQDIPYALVLIWAFVGIASKQSDSALVSGAAGVLAALLALYCGLFLLKKLRTK